MNFEKFLDNPNFTILTVIYSKNKILLEHSIELEPDFPPILMESKSKVYKKIINLYYTKKLPDEIIIDYHYLKEKYYLIPDSQINVLLHPGILFDDKSPFRYVAFYGPYKVKEFVDYNEETPF
jgi:hypothetical protein